MNAQQQSQEESTQENPSEEDESISDAIVPDSVEVDPRKALMGGAVATLISIAGTWAVGQLHGSKGLVLLEAMLPTTRFLCSSVMTATATILALMLTLLGLSANSSSQFRSSHYERVRQIAFIATIAFVLATLFLLVLTIPLEESDNIDAGWYNTAFYVVLASSSLLGGILIAIVLMLYDAVRDMTHVFGLDEEDSPLVKDKPESDPDS